MKNIIIAIALIVITYLISYNYIIHNIQISDISDNAVILNINNRYEVYNYKGGN